MKRIFVLLPLLFSFSCKDKPTEKYTDSAQNETITTPRGQELFESNNCMACHQLNTKVIGPSIADIAKIYKEKKGNLISFLKGEAPAIVDPEQYPSMQVNLEITKKMSDLELQALEKYILNPSN